VSKEEELYPVHVDWTELRERDPVAGPTLHDTERYLYFVSVGVLQADLEDIVAVLCLEQDDDLTLPEERKFRDQPRPPEEESCPAVLISVEGRPIEEVVRRQTTQIRSREVLLPTAGCRCVPIEVSWDLGRALDVRLVRGVTLDRLGPSWGEIGGDRRKLRGRPVHADAGDHDAAEE